MMAFYMESGFDANDALDVVALGVPNARPAAPMGYDMGYVPMSDPAERQAFLMRMNTYRPGCVVARDASAVYELSAFYGAVHEPRARGGGRGSPSPATGRLPS